jgi:type I restriction enzyme S subunit
VRANGRLDGRLINAYLSIPAVKRQLLGNSAGGTRKAVTKAHIETLPVPVPPHEEQDAIAEVLEAIDNRIESGRRLRELLTAFSQVLVDDLLSRSGQPSATLGDVLDVIETGTRPRGGVTGIVEGVPSIGAESITEAGDFDFGRTNRVPVDFFDRMSRGKLQAGDVLLYKDGGRPGQFEPHVSMIGEGFPFAVAAINEHVYRLRIRPPYSQAFLYFWLRGGATMEEMRRRGTGVAIPGLNSSNVKGLPFPSIDPHELAQTRAVIDVTAARVLQLAREARSLSTFRDAITPELLSGRKRLGALQEHSGARS